LLDDTPNFIGEKSASGNVDSVKGYMLVDIIKAELDKACKGPVVSCADILAVAARDSVSIVSENHTYTLNYNFKVNKQSV
jgi:peroxidase